MYSGRSLFDGCFSVETGYGMHPLYTSRAAGSPLDYRNFVAKTCRGASFIFWVGLSLRIGPFGDWLVMLGNSCRQSTCDWFWVVLGRLLLCRNHHGCYLLLSQHTAWVIKLDLHAGGEWPCMNDLFWPTVIPTFIKNNDRPPKLESFYSNEKPRLPRDKSHPIGLQVDISHDTTNGTYI